MSAASMQPFATLQPVATFRFRPLHFVADLLLGLLACILFPIPSQAPNLSELAQFFSQQSDGSVVDLPASPAQSEALPPEPSTSPLNSFSERVCVRLFQAEAHEPDAWLRDDYRQAFITVSFAAKGNPIPFIEASYVMYGLHPDKLYPAILARRKALLGPGGEALLSAHNALPASPKKPVQSATRPRKEEAA